MFVLTTSVYIKTTYIINMLTLKTPHIQFVKISITDVLIKSMSCHWLSRGKHSKVIMSFCCNIVPYYPSEGFVMAKYNVTETSVWK